MTGDLRVEMYLSGDWHDVTDDARGERSAVRIERGAGAESGRRPSTCIFTLDNRDGRYSPRNPTGVHFGSLTRNTPQRAWRGLVNDPFDDRAVAEGWGIGPGGETWATGAGGGTILPTDTSVAGGLGVHSVPAAGAYRRTYIADRTYGPVEVRATFTLAFSDVTGGQIEPGNVTVRGISGPTNYWMARVTIQPDETVRVGLLTHLGVIVADEVTVPDLPYTGQALTVSLVAEGQSLRAKVWASDGPEPIGWHVSGHDPDMPAAGYVGARTGVGVGNTNVKPVVASYSAFEVRDPRVYVEVSQWPTRTDRAGTDVLTRITGSGPLRRLGQGGRALRSALYRGIAGESVGTPVAYWPCEDGRDATVLASGVAGGQPMRIVGGVSPAANSTAACSAAIPTYGTGTARGTVKPYSSAAALRLFALLSVPETVPVDQTLLQVQTKGTVVRWRLRLSTTGAISVQALDSSSTLLVDSAIGFDLLGETGLIRLYLTQDGTAIDWEVGWSNVSGSGAGIGDGSLASRTLGAAVAVDVGSGADLNGTAVGHIALYNLPLSFWDLNEFAQAWIRERAVDRMVRLAREEGIPLVVTGRSSDSERMGPQRPASFLDLVRECAEVDQGLLGESRGSLGLAYRTRVSLYNQTPMVTVAGAQLERPDDFVAVDDDRLVVNEVTATRPDGASYTHVQGEGPLAAADPPDGVGRYDRPVVVNVASDYQLIGQASWRVHVGTCDESRYPTTEVDLVAYPELLEQALAADSGDRVVITGPPAHLAPDDISTLIQGYAETWTAYGTTLVWSLVPESPYRLAVLDDSVLGRADTAGCELDQEATSSDVLLVARTTRGPAWTTDPAEAGFDIRIGGEVCTVTDVGAPVTTVDGITQEMTVVRSVNGVTKAHPAGTDIRLDQPANLAR